MGLFGNRGTVAPGNSRYFGDPGWPLIPPRDPGSKASAGYQASLAIPTVWACVTLRADMLSSSPLRTYVRNADGTESEVRNPPLIVNPSADFSTDEWLYASQVSLDMRGNSYGIIVARDNEYRPTQVELQHPDSVTVDETNKGDIKYRIGNTEYSSYEIWHERQFVQAGSVLGLSVIANFARTLRIPIAASQYGLDWFDQGTHPTGVLSNKNLRELTDEQVLTVRKRFMAGIANRSEPVVLSGGWDWTTISIAPGEAQFLETQRFSAGEIARMWRIPGYLLDLDTGTGMSYSNGESRGLQFLTYSMGPTFRRRQRALQAATPDNTTTRFDTGDILAVDRLTEARTRAIYVASKVLAQDEVRADMGKPPLDDQQTEQLQSFNAAPATNDPGGNAGNDNAKSTEGA